MRVVVTGGGSGGHIFPALAVAESLDRFDPGGERLYIGGASGMETEIVPRRGVPFQAVTARKLRRVLSPSTLGVLFSLCQGYRQAKASLRNFKAEAVVGTGGYVAAAAVLAGVRLGLPTLILAPDLVPGRTNRLLARFAKRICVVFPDTVAQFPPGKTVVTGLPLRKGIVAPAEITPAQARRSFPGLAPDRFTVVVIGGSQGARAVNSVVLEAAPQLLECGIQVLHQTGAKHIAEVCALAQALNLPENAGYCPLAFLEEEQVSLALRAADLFVCRGGISTLSEALVNGVPSLIVPLPTSYADHQTANAKALESAGAALHRPEKDLTASNLIADILNLRDDPARLRRMSDACRSLSRPDAADEVADIVLQWKDGNA
jgi:UDP-N-acetylglucosamine--N-acetylmuramyl-(pentapeptide) pyrophosphoryl-undecaprenol N-acetylglucosamine transferase